MNKLLVLNHKMSLNYDELYSYINTLNNINTNADIIVCPSNIYLEAFLNNSDYVIGAQNMHYETDYNSTGEVSSMQLKSLGVELVMIGHSERITKFHENSKIINSKLIAALESNIEPILCIGEDIDENYEEVIKKQLDNYLENVERIDFIIFAYEPVYAINSGILPSIDKIEEVTKFINDYLESKYKVKPKIIYGGGVNSSNISDLSSIKNIDGFLIGSISSDIKEVVKIVNKLS